MYLKNFILRFNTYGQVNYNLPIDRLIIYDLNHGRRELFSCNFYLQPFTCDNILFDIDNHHNLLLTSNEYNNDLYLIINIDDDHYAYYQFTHTGLTFVIFKVYPPGVHYIFDAGRKASFRCNCNEYFSTALYMAHLSHFDLLNPKFFDDPRTLSIENSELNLISDNLFLAIAKLNSLAEPYKLLYAIK